MAVNIGFDFMQDFIYDYYLCLNKMLKKGFIL